MGGARLLRCFLCDGSGRGGKLSGICVSPEPLEVRLHVRGRLIPQITVLLHRLIDDAFEFGGDFRIYTRNGGGGSIKDGFENEARGFTAERQSTGGHFIEDGAERKRSVRGSSSLPLTCSGDM